MKKKKTSIPPIEIPAIMLLIANDKEFKSYYTSKGFKVHGSTEEIDQIWDRAKKLSVK